MGEQVISDHCDFGWTTVWASEMGDEKVLDGLLRHADRFMQPTWRNGGLYYPRNDQLEDEFGNRTLMEPHTGNVLIAYARLNVPDGLWRLYNEPVDRSFFENPALTRVADDVEVQRAVFEDGVLRLTLARRPDTSGNSDVLIGRIRDRGQWMLRCDGRDVARGTGLAIDASPALDIKAEPDGLALECPVGVHELEMRFL